MPPITPMIRQIIWSVFHHSHAQLTDIECAPKRLTGLACVNRRLDISPVRSRKSQWGYLHINDLAHSCSPAFGVMPACVDAWTIDRPNRDRLARFIVTKRITDDTASSLSLDTPPGGETRASYVTERVFEVWIVATAVAAASVPRAVKAAVKQSTPSRTSAAHWGVRGRCRPMPSPAVRLSGPALKVRRVRLRQSLESVFEAA